MTALIKFFGRLYLDAALVTLSSIVFCKEISATSFKPAAPSFGIVDAILSWWVSDCFTLPGVSFGASLKAADESFGWICLKNVAFPFFPNDNAGKELAK